MGKRGLAMGGKLTLDVLYNNRFCKYVHDNNQFYDIVFNDLIANVRKVGGEENLIATANGGHLFYAAEPLYDYDIVTMSLYGIRYSEFLSYLKGADQKDVEEYLKKLRKEALEAISYVELEFYIKNNCTYRCALFYAVSSNKDGKYCENDIQELEDYGIHTTDRIKEVV